MCLDIITCVWITCVIQTKTPHMYYMCMNYMCNKTKTPHMYYICMNYMCNKN